MKRIYLFAAAALCASAIGINAQDKPAEGQGRRGGNPIFASLDTNGDGTIDANEINNAPAALRKLDKNSDGKLTREELRGDRAGRAKGEGQRHRDPNSSSSSSSSSSSEKK
jgi:hypothetical protein